MAELKEDKTKATCSRFLICSKPVQYYGESTVEIHTGRHVFKLKMKTAFEFMQIQLPVHLSFFDISFIFPAFPVMVLEVGSASF